MIMAFLLPANFDLQLHKIKTSYKHGQAASAESIKSWELSLESSPSTNATSLQLRALARSFGLLWVFNVSEISVTAGCEATPCSM